MDYVDTVNSIKGLANGSAEKEGTVDFASATLFKAATMLFLLFTLYMHYESLSDEIWLRSAGELQRSNFQIVFGATAALLFFIPSFIPKKKNFKKIINIIFVFASSVVVGYYCVRYSNSVYIEKVNENLKNLFKNDKSELTKKFENENELSIHTTSLDMVLEGYTASRTNKFTIQIAVLMIVITIIEAFLFYSSRRINITEPKKTR